ncbi:unnamed protein product [Clavelina lepadiformis]|uniref:Uncharacterized protein n=1 Tax=Clavelina lepadiformis TaxID=159417 RepID=A0ABP0G6Z7_CLALP
MKIVTLVYSRHVGLFYQKNQRKHIKTNKGKKLDQGSFSSCQSRRAFDKVNKPNKQTNETLDKSNYISTSLGKPGGYLQCGNFRLEFPASSLVEETNIRLQTLPGKDFFCDGKKFFAISNVIRCEPAGTRFRKPCTVSTKQFYRRLEESELKSLAVFIRKHHEEDTWKPLKYSTCGLLKDGRFSFRIRHFSDFVVALSGSQRKELVSVAFVESLSNNLRKISWYVVESFQTFNEIRRLIDRETLIPYETFSVSSGHDFQLNLRCDRFSSPYINIDRKKVSILAAQIDLTKIVICNQFLITEKPHYAKVLTFHYSITQPMTAVEDNKVLFGQFYVTWGAKEYVGSDVESSSGSDTGAYQ